MIKNRILVTGGAGFIGSHLCSRLLNEDNEVICLDNFFTGSKDNVKNLLKDENFKIIEHNIIDPIDLKVDQIYNLASPASPVHYQSDPVNTIKTNVNGAINVLEIARKYGAKILQASTSEVYGDPEVHPQPESYVGSVNPIGPRACYDEGKRAAETLFFDYYRQYQVRIRVVRIFNTYGPNMEINDGRVISNFITQALKNIPISIFGDGSQTRSFCYVDDMVEGLINMMNQDNGIGPVNLGNPDEVTISDLAKEVIKLCNSNSKINFNPLPQDDPLQRKPDVQKAVNLINWNTKVDRNEGLIKTINYFKNFV